MWMVTGAGQPLLSQGDVCGGAASSVPSGPGSHTTALWALTAPSRSAEELAVCSLSVTAQDMAVWHPDLCVFFSVTGENKLCH